MSTGYYNIVKMPIIEYRVCTDKFQPGMDIEQVYGNRYSNPSLAFDRLLKLPNGRRDFAVVPCSHCGGAHIARVFHHGLETVSNAV